MAPVGASEVRLELDAPGVRELTQMVSQLTVLPPNCSGRGKSGKTKHYLDTMLEPPLGLGPYRMFEPGRAITCERVADYGSEDLLLDLGTNNFARLRYDYFCDPNVAFEDFTAG
jgi:microcin C transport system substrate-binding protein